MGEERVVVNLRKMGYTTRSYFGVSLNQILLNDVHGYMVNKRSLDYKRFDCTTFDLGIKTGFNLIIFHFNIRENLSIIRCDN